jgi:hypothetical protein
LYAFFPLAGASPVASAALLPAVAHQLATRQAAAARDVLLLLGFASLQAGSGGGGGGPGGLAAAPGLADLASRWHAQLLAASLALLLAATPAEAPSKGLPPHTQLNPTCEHYTSEFCHFFFF